MKLKILFFIAFYSSIVANNLSGYDLAKLIDDKKQPQSSKSEIKMQLINLKKDRIKIKEMVSLSKDDGNKMLLFLKVPKEIRELVF